MFLYIICNNLPHPDPYVSVQPSLDKHIYVLNI